MKYMPVRLMLMLDGGVSDDNVTRSAALDAMVTEHGPHPDGGYHALASCRWRGQPDTHAMATATDEGQARIEALTGAVAAMYARVFGNG